MNSDDLKRPGHELDETTRRRLEETLREAEERHRAFIALNTVAIWRLELREPLSIDEPVDTQIDCIYRDCYVAECNDAYARKYDRTLANEMIGLGAEDINPRSAPGSIELIIEFINSGYRLRNYENVKVYPDGSRRTFLTDYFGIVVDRKLVRAWGSSRDITELKTARQALHDSELQYRDIFEGATTGIAIRTLAGEIVAANPALCRIYGYSREEYMRLSPVKLAHPDSLKTFRELQKAVSRGEEFRTEGRGIHKDGHTIELEIYGTRIMYAGQPHILASLIDITERKQAEERLRMSTEALRMERESLKQKNIALSQVLEHLEVERESYRHEICDSVEKLLTPILEKLKETDGQLRPRDVAVLEDSLHAIVARDLDLFQSNMSKLSPRELDIVERIRRGLATKEIAAQLNLSEQTVHKHRKLIRRKLQLRNKSINLAAYLRSR